MKFEIKHWIDGRVIFTADIEATEDTPFSVRLGLAVKVAVKNRASLVGARLDGASLDGARLDRASLDGARLVGARLDGASLDGASLVGARLDGASLVGARLDGARLDRASLDGARLVGARLDGARLDRASLDGARLVGARLDGALFRNGDVAKRLITCAVRLDGYAFFGIELRDGGVKILAGCRWFSLAEFREHVKLTYPKTPKADETNDIIDFIETRAKSLKCVMKFPKPKKEA